MRIEREAPDHFPITKITLKDGSYMLGKLTKKTITLQPSGPKICVRHKSSTEGEPTYFADNFKLSITAARELAEALCVLTDDMEEKEEYRP